MLAARNTLGAKIDTHAVTCQSHSCATLCLAGRRLHASGALSALIGFHGVNGNDTNTLARADRRPAFGDGFGLRMRLTGSAGLRMHPTTAPDSIWRGFPCRERVAQLVEQLTFNQ
jgi:hypothetical protein